MSYRITVDTGGTFTDVVLSDPDGRFVVGKSPTTPKRAFDGVRGGLEVIAEQLDRSVAEILADTSLFVYSTTRSTNAILEGTTAKTAFLVTEGFPDVLVLREGGKLKTFEFRDPFPEPYIPRRLTFEVPERVGSDGSVRLALDEDALRETLRGLRRRDVEAVAVCLLWSTENPDHELAVGRLIEQELPGVPYTLSHQINPIVREYRRASSAAIDASLKPMMGEHLRAVSSDLREAGLTGELMVATSFGGVMYLEDLSERPIFSVRSGPSMAPIAARTYGAADLDRKDVIVCDAGGTSFDVSLVRDGDVTYTRDTWLGPVFTGHLTGSTSVDVRSIGAGGGSIAWVDPGGLLHVGPQSAGADPGPACYGRGGDRPTVTDAAVLLGYIDPASFLGGRMALDASAAERVLGTLGEQLGLSAHEAARAVLDVANEHMVGAVREMTINEGIDPRESLVVAGGGAAGLNIAEICRELGCDDILIPRTAGALSAAGAQFADVVSEFNQSFYARTTEFDFDGVNAVLDDLDEQVRAFADRLRERGMTEMRTEYFVSARYLYQVWELELPLRSARFGGPDDLTALSRGFDEIHERLLAVADPGAPLECLTWKARLTATVETAGLQRLGAGAGTGGSASRTRRASFRGEWLDATVVPGGDLRQGETLNGPAIIEEATSTIVVPPDCSVTVTAFDNYHLEVK